MFLYTKNGIQTIVIMEGKSFIIAKMKQLTCVSQRSLILLIRELLLKIDKFESLVESIKPFMINSIWRILRDKELCQDALQEALTSIWKNFENIRTHPNPRALVIKISANKAYDSLRKADRHMKNVEFQEQASETPSVNFSGAKNIENSQVRQEIITAMSYLPRKQHTAIYMRLIEEISYGSIASAMKCREGTVRNHVKRGREKLKKSLAHLKFLEEKI